MKTRAMDRELVPPLLPVAGILLLLVAVLVGVLLPLRPVEVPPAMPERDLSSFLDQESLAGAGATGTSDLPHQRPRRPAPVRIPAAAIDQPTPELSEQLSQLPAALRGRGTSTLPLSSAATSQYTQRLAKASDSAAPTATAEATAGPPPVPKDALAERLACADQEETTALLQAGCSESGNDQSGGGGDRDGRGEDQRVVEASSRKEREGQGKPVVVSATGQVRSSDGDQRGGRKGYDQEAQPVAARPPAEEALIMVGRPGRRFALPHILSVGGQEPGGPARRAGHRAPLPQVSPAPRSDRPSSGDVASSRQPIGASSQAGPLVVAGIVPEAGSRQAEQKLAGPDGAGCAPLPALVEKPTRLSGPERQVAPGSPSGEYEYASLAEGPGKARRLPTGQVEGRIGPVSNGARDANARVGGQPRCAHEQAAQAGETKACSDGTESEGRAVEAGRGAIEGRPGSGQGRAREVAMMPRPAREMDQSGAPPVEEAIGYGRTGPDLWCDDFENTVGPWAVAEWGNPAGARWLRFKDGGRGLGLMLKPGDREKAVLTRKLGGDGGAADMRGGAITVDIHNAVSSPLRFSLVVACQVDGAVREYELPARTLRPGWNLAMRFALEQARCRGVATGWRDYDTLIDHLDQVAAIRFCFYNGDMLGGPVIIDNVKLEPARQGDGASLVSGAGRR